MRRCPPVAVLVTAPLLAVFVASELWLCALATCAVYVVLAARGGRSA